MDEEAHVDLVIKYSQGAVPTSLQLISAESAFLIAKYSSPEFFFRPFDFASNEIPLQAWNKQNDSIDYVRLKSRIYWGMITNHECSSPPLYYILAGSWLRLGLWTGMLKFDSLATLYWIRILNVAFVFLLMYFAHRSLLLIYPRQNYLRAAVLLLLAFFPQDSYYSVQSDVLSPVCFAACFYYLLRIFLNDKLKPAHHFYCGLFLALTVLSKTSNLVFLPVLILLVLVLFLRKKAERPAGFSFLVFIAPVLILVGAWIAWNLKYYGDITGTAPKVHILGWQPQKILNGLQNSLFSFNGFMDFSKELFASFWRGEFVWNRERLCHNYLDVFYWTSSLLLPLVTLASLPGKRSTDAGKKINLLAALFFFSSFLFVIYLSLHYDFSESPYPSKDRPYFTSGRLMSGALLPFLVLFVSGLQKCIGKWAGDRFVFFLVLIICIAITTSEFILNQGAMDSTYNFFS